VEGLELRLIKFAIVGTSGVVVNLGLLYILVEWFGLYYMLAAVISIGSSVVSNYILNDKWTWRDRK